MKGTIFWAITPSSPLKSTDVSEEHIASIFRVEALIATCFEAGFFLGLFFNAKDGGDSFLINVG
jgi:hypothetical protein